VQSFVRGLVFSVAGLIVVVVVLLLALLAAQDTHAVTLTLLGGTFTTRLWILAAGTAVLGLILGFLLSTPARFDVGRAIGALRREGRAQGRELATLHTQETQLAAAHTQLQADNADLVRERDDVQAHLEELPKGAATATTATTPAPPASAASDASDVTTTTVTAPSNSEQHTPDPPARVVERPLLDEGRERLRGAARWLRRSLRRDGQEGAYPQSPSSGPPAPTA
jgi:uncharacterized integral membrane protein